VLKRTAGTKQLGNEAAQHHELPAGRRSGELRARAPARQQRVPAGFEESHRAPTTSNRCSAASSPRTPSLRRST
jgi:hypothetical protein